MNKETLINKKASWNIERVNEFFNFVPMPTSYLPSNKFWEYSDDELYLISGATVRYFKEDGTIMVLARDTLDPSFSLKSRDQEVINVLAEASKSQSVFRIAELLEVSYVTIANENFEFRHYRSPSSQLGIPFLADTWSHHDSIDDDFFITYIDSIAFMIKTLTDQNLPFPRRPYFEKRLRDDQGWYFYDLDRFTRTYEEFYVRSINLIERAVNNNIRRQKIQPKFNVTNPAELVAYAESKWKL